MNAILSKPIIPALCAWCEQEAGIHTTGSHGICARHSAEQLAALRARKNNFPVPEPKTPAKCEPPTRPMKYKIENVPMLPRHHSVMKELNRSMRRMSKGQSFMVHTRNEQCYVFRVAKKIKIKILTRKIDGEGIRVYRIK